MILFARLALSVGLCCSLLSTLATAQTLTAPSSRNSNESGMRLWINLDGPTAVGYRTARIQLTSSNMTPNAREREFIVQLTVYRSFGRARTTVRCPVTVLSGQLHGDGTVRIPHDDDGFSNRYEVQVFESGSEWPDLNVAAYDSTNQGQAPPSYRMYLIVDRNFHSVAVKSGKEMYPQTGDDWDTSLTLRAAPLYAGYGFASYIQSGRGHIFAMTQFDRMGELTAVHPDDLPEDWIALDYYHGVVITADHLLALQQNRPEAFEALMRWWRTGRVLISDAAAGETSMRAWADDTLGDPQDNDRIEWKNLSEVSVGPIPVRGQPSLLADANKFIAIRDDGRSRMVLLDKAATIDHVRLAEIAFSSPARNDHELVSRTGYSLSDSEWRFNDYLIPGVGLPPVNWFRVLITVFAIVIGPVNYFVLRRMKRLYLMLITVPLGALAVCAALLGYALLADGLAVRTRMLSYTEIDQSSGHAISWSRQAYYTGFMRGEGYRFPDDATVYPLVSDSFRRRQYRWIWNEGWQTVQGGNTGSRTTSQYLVSTSDTTGAGLGIEVDEQGAPTEVRNDLRTEIRIVGIVDERGTVYRAEGISDGATFEPQAVSEVDFRVDFSRIIREGQPQTPSGMTSLGRGMPASGRSFGFDDAGMLGSALRGCLDLDKLPPRSYWAIVEHSPEVPTAAGHTVETDSLHVVVGYW